MWNTRPRYKKYCCVYNCLNKSHTDSDLSFFNVPADIERRRQWLTAIDREDLLEENKSKPKYNYVCAAHFDDDDIITTVAKRLKNDAVPKKLLHDKSLEDESDSCEMRMVIECSPQDLVHSTKDLPTHTIKKEDVVVSTYTHSLKALSKEIETKIEISHMSLSELKQESNTTSTQTDLIKTSDKKTQTKKDVSDKSPQKRKLEKQVEIIKSKRKRLQNEVMEIKKKLKVQNASLLSDSEDDVGQKFMKLIQWQNKIKNKFKGNRYDAQYKLFALNLHYASPHAYRCLQSFLKLPSKSTLHRLKFTLPPKLDDRILDSLSLKIKSLPDNAKCCTICVGEMVLKRNLYYDIKKDEVIGFQNINGAISPEIASHTYVIMLQGIYCNWKQPIAYAFLGNTGNYAELDAWINDVILKLFGVGIEVKAIISNQDSFDAYAKVIKNVTIDKPYFFVNEHKVYYIFDVPNLLKCVRDDLLSSDFYYEQDKISWDYIKTLYELQKEKNFRLIPKITHDHVKPNNVKKMKIKYAAEIFSSTVNAALETYIDFGLIPEVARGTAKFIKTMNNLFDVLNSSKTISAKKYQTALKMSNEQKTILEDTQQMFATMKSTNLTQNDNADQINTFHNFQITIQSILQLFEDLKSEGYQYLFTRRLSQDNMETFYGSINQGGFGSELTPIQFTQAFSKLFYTNMLQSDETKNEPDIFEMLLKAEDVINKETLNIPDSPKKSLVALNGENDYQIDLPEVNTLTYVASFLLFKCYEKHPTCKEMSGMLDSSQNLDEPNFREYNENMSFYGNLKIPSQEISEYVQKLETVFTQNFIPHLHGNPGSEIFELLQKIQLPTLPCSCFPVEYFLSLFVRLRIFSTLKFNNSFESISYLMVTQLYL